MAEGAGSEEVAAYVNMLEQAKVAIQDTLDAIEADYPDLEVSGFAFEPFRFFSPAVPTGLVRSPGIEAGLADSHNEKCVNWGC
jgi:hypothetical protein